MDLLPRSFGERVWFRLSDVPLDKRLKAADQLADQLARAGTFDVSDLVSDFERRTREAAEIHRAAENPSDVIRTVSLDAWVKAMGAPP